MPDESQAAKKAKLLFIDDDVAVCDVIQTMLTNRGFDVVCANSGAAALALLERETFNAVISDLNMPGTSGLDLCKRLHTTSPGLPLVLVTAFGSMETAVAAIRAGAYDFISKPIQLSELLLTLERALEHRKLKAENTELRETVARHQSPAEMIGESPVMKELYSILERIGDTDATVLITGESGTGKELVAQTVHRRGPHATGPLVALNCAAVPETMLESELFGHARGAFTDAKQERKGLFVQANGGSLFLDEIGEMPSSTQVKLLRALQERKVRPVGSDREVPFDARVISATSRDLETEVAEHRFREDLYYRVNVIRIHVPPLRARGRDVLLLAEHFLRRFSQQFKKSVSGIESAAAEKLLAYSWPGNVRELQNCIERALALTESNRVTLQDLPQHIREFKSASFVLPLENPEALVPLEEVEKRYILQVLKALQGRKTETAQILRLDRRTLYRKLKSYGVT